MMGVLGTEPSMDEDCLVLNVWTPTAQGRIQAARPGLAPWWRNEYRVGILAALRLHESGHHRNVVVIGVNHRLGILGFLDLSAIGEEFADSGNVGMLDVASALAWVGQNVAGFGGDPGNVTVFGESGGGTKTTTLLAMPPRTACFTRRSR